MTTMQVIFLALWICCTAFNFWYLSRGMWSDKTFPWIAHAGVLLAAMIPMATPVIAVFVVRSWVQRHWNIVKIERSLRD